MIGYDMLLEFFQHIPSNIDNAIDMFQCLTFEKKGFVTTRKYKPAFIVGFNLEVHVIRIGVVCYFYITEFGISRTT